MGLRRRTTSSTPSTKSKSNRQPAIARHNERSLRPTKPQASSTWRPATERRGAPAGNFRSLSLRERLGEGMRGRATPERRLHARGSVDPLAPLPGERPGEGMLRPSILSKRDLLTPWILLPLPQSISSLPSPSLSPGRGTGMAAATSSSNSLRSSCSCCSSAKRPILFPGHDLTAVSPWARAFSATFALHCGRDRQGERYPDATAAATACRRQNQPF